MLVPLTASLYVPGSLDDAEKVLVDVGTGYFIEKTMAQGKEYCERKINLLKSNFDELVEVRGYEKESHSRRYGFATTSQAEASVTGPKFMRAGCTPRLFYLCCIKHHLVILKLGVTQQRRLYSLASSVAQHTL
ncbi:putative prefoldin subunit 5 [Zea mays]|uniref:Putative prefoldin subunit 5 n=1 Tax=Zea mays TaxID=4577 RepID=A0A317YH66_MAIZE|nr:putative prefoldin subunit 5 [Zea mays]